MSLQVSGSFAANGNSGTLSINRPHIKFNLSLSGLTDGGATVTVQRSFDGGSTWKDVQAYTSDIETYGEDISSNVLYRLACSSYSSGTILYELGY